MNTITIEEFNWLVSYGKWARINNTEIVSDDTDVIYGFSSVTSLLIAPKALSGLIIEFSQCFNHDRDGDILRLDNTGAEDDIVIIKGFRVERNGVEVGQAELIEILTGTEFSDVRLPTL